MGKIDIRDLDETFYNKLFNIELILGGIDKAHYMLQSFIVKNYIGMVLKIKIDLKERYQFRNYLQFCR